METVTLPKGTIVKFQGIPFELPEDTPVIGTQKNLEYAQQLRAEKSAARGIHVEGGGSEPILNDNTVAG